MRRDVGEARTGITTSTNANTEMNAAAATEDTRQNKRTFMSVERLRLRLRGR